MGEIIWLENLEKEVKVGFESEDDISNVIKRISSSYVLWYNKKYERCGHLFQERFKSQPNKNRALDLFIEYMNENNEDVFLVFEDYINLTDSEVLKNYTIEFLIMQWKQLL